MIVKSASRQRSNARWLYIAPSILIFWIVANIDKGSMGILATSKPFLHELGLAGNPAELGLVLSIFVWPYGISAFAWGFVVDRYGSRKAAVFSVIGWAIAMVIGGASYGIGQLMASRVILGVSEAALWPVSLKLTATWYSHSERGRAKTSYGYGQMVGFAIGTIFVTFLLVTISWRAAFFILAGLAIVLVMPPFLLLVRDIPSEHYAVNDAEQQYIGTEGQRALVGKDAFSNWRSLPTIVRNYRYWLVIYTFVVSSVASFGIISWLPSYLEKARHFSPALMATWTTLAYVAGIIIFLIVSYLGDRTQYFAVIGAVELVVAVVCFIVAGTTTHPLVAAPLVAIGFGAAVATVITTPAVLQYYAGTDVHGAATGIMTGVGNLCGGFAPLIIGVLVAAGHGNFVGAFIFLTVVTALGAVAYAALIRGEIARVRSMAGRTTEHLTAEHG